jgi:hypothetical protein
VTDETLVVMNKVGRYDIINYFAMYTIIYQFSMGDYFVGWTCCLHDIHVLEQHGKKWRQNNLNEAGFFDKHSPPPKIGKIQLLI